MGFAFAQFHALPMPNQKIADNQWCRVFKFQKFVPIFGILLFHGNSDSF